MDKISRRSFFKMAGGAAAALTVPGANAAAPAKAASAAAPFLFLKGDDARFIEAAVERLIPADEVGPGALDAGVPTYIDRQLAGAWGAGERLYRSGPWAQGAPTQGYQLPFTPAELFSHALRGIQADLKNRGSKPFHQLSAADQDAYLKSLEGGNVDLDGVPSKVFFQSLLELTIEGFFSDPIYGGNKDMVAWKMIGFPGAYANYYHLVDQHGIQFTRAPMSIGEDARGVIHIQPVSSKKASTPHQDQQSHRDQHKGGK
ncbi:gluconate 2-dehydrogenase gamma chain [Paucimonas lemoignei]|uniref:Gluconate 2-dehydrogenase gamma chain n=1 Tax=Paucimonas lemoignei TaxID=29443 RepID=A0A4R3HW14_PAULE|nr:gluconate 2-dehydrogenase subunit 3 family protein [Paucimonas lemoignei]TCS36275.1 gluconate 2-dehydrogenase gamma chain [Paucimonas lemoignei]